MLNEYKKVRQVPGGYRKLYSDDAFDLWVWFDKPDGDLVGFQLVILSQLSEDTVFTWTTDKGSIYTGLLDEGHRYKKTRFLSVNGKMDKSKVLSSFNERSGGLPGELKVLVSKELAQYVQN